MVTFEDKANDPVTVPPALGRDAEATEFMALIKSVVILHTGYIYIFKRTLGQWWAW